jgi:hypothetical protein
VAATLLAAAGILCAVGGFALAYAPLRTLRLDQGMRQSREVRAIRLLGLLLMTIGAYVTVTSLLTGAPILPLPPPVPTPTMVTRIL